MLSKQLIITHATYYTQKMTQQYQLCLYVAVEVCASCSRVILWSVQKLFGHTTYDCNFNPVSCMGMNVLRTMYADHTVFFF